MNMILNLKSKAGVRRFLALAILLGIGAIRWFGDSPDSQGPYTEAQRDGAAAIESAFRAHRSGEWVQASGVVDRLLSDDTVGNRHQRFIVRLSGSRTILISHNIDLAKRLPLEPGDAIAFRGKYEWNERGGIVHWTHHDPRAGRHRKDLGGWLRVGNVTVR